VISSVPTTPTKPTPPKKDAGQDARGVEMSNTELLGHCELILRFYSVVTIILNS
jgi:hypothetical protein